MLHGEYNEKLVWLIAKWLYGNTKDVACMTASTFVFVSLDLGIFSMGYCACIIGISIPIKLRVNVSTRATFSKIHPVFVTNVLKIRIKYKKQTLC